jgi:hypothetical protein
VEQDRSFIAQARRHSAVARRVRTRARCDIVLIGVATGIAAHLAADAHEALLAASLVLSLGILAYVIRRDRDLALFADTARWRDDALEGRGLPLSEWRRGARLPPWDERGGRPADPGD